MPSAIVLVVPVNHLSAERASQIYSACPSLIGRRNEQTGTPRDALLPTRGLAVLAGAGLKTS